jgi:glycosyltransferase involved in cell wall biosynthesis
VKIGIYRPLSLSFSVANYIDNIAPLLEKMGNRCSCFHMNESLPTDVDLFWDPRCTGGMPPHTLLSRLKIPLVATLHGAGPFVLVGTEYYRNRWSAWLSNYSRFKKLVSWKKFSGHLAAIITVSEYAKSEITCSLGLHQEQIIPIYHGVDHELYTLKTSGFQPRKPYFLHVSQYQPKKNVGRIISAYSRLKHNNKADLVMIVPGYRGDHVSEPGVRIMRDKLSGVALAQWYRGALAFVFPSLHESFGMPIVEAMASGCPVITSGTTACPEVAGDAAILVDPRSVDDISRAMERLLLDPQLAGELRDKGVMRASLFTWEESADRHLQVFRNAVLHAS